MNALETERLTLRPITLEDAPLVLAVMNDPDFVRYVSDRGLRTPADAARYITEKMLPGFEQNGFGMCAVRLKESGMPIGTCGIFKRNRGDDAEIGFAFLPNFRGRGFALEAAAAVMNYARDVLKLTRIIAATKPINAESIKLLEKLGMRFERMIFDDACKAEMKLFASAYVRQLDYGVTRVAAATEKGES